MIVKELEREFYRVRRLCAWSMRGNGMTFKEIGEKLKVSTERARQLSMQGEELDR